MNCPKCKYPTQVLYTRDAGDRRIRSRSCKSQDCDMKFRTEEVYVVENEQPKYLPFSAIQNDQSDQQALNN